MSQKYLMASQGDGNGGRYKKPIEMILHAINQKTLLITNANIKKLNT
jgi:hypothetical protein